MTRETVITDGNDAGEVMAGSADCALTHVFMSASTLVTFWYCSPGDPK